jgi:hypothetical protein
LQYENIPSYVYSGADIKATIVYPILTFKGNGQPLEMAYSKPEVIGELMTVTYSIHREMVPVRSLGFTGVRGIVRGPRTVAGSMIFAVFNRDLISQFKEQLLKSYRAYYGYLGLQMPSSLDRNLLLDEMPPFDIHCYMAPELQMPGEDYYRNLASSVTIRGCHIVNEGQVMSIEDTLTERTLQYIAEDIVTHSHGSGGGVDPLSSGAAITIKR